MTTDFSKQIDILGEFYLMYKDDPQLQDFIEFNDVGLPLAYLASENLCELTLEGRPYIIETWELFMAALDIEDSGFENLNEIFAKKNSEEE